MSMSLPRRWGAGTLVVAAALALISRHKSGLVRDRRTLNADSSGVSGEPGYYNNLGVGLS